ncbi:MAG: hypothetical protein GTO02_22170 [Candidatus Dadabacteria bacterium]|nr:hypothetical protein [Candidatus Dadabacteria bacterium]NIQ16987.1 hypothetical protein [Candidatus Dadabacteria bacterium]
MSILNTVSVGDIFYYQVDDIPNHVAPKGSISILNTELYENSLMWVNNDGDSTWLKIISNSYSEMFLNDNTTTVGFDSQTASVTPPFSWYSWAGGDTYTEGDSIEFIKSNDATFGDNLEYTGSTLIRAIVYQTSTNRGGSGKWMSWRFGPAKNFIAPDRGYNDTYVLANESTNNCSGSIVFEFANGDNTTAAISPIEREGGGGPPQGRNYIPKHTQLVVTKIDEALKSINFNEGWESSGFTENSWTVVNDTTNVWVVGQAENNGGTSSAYVSDDGGTSASYTITTANVSHFYKDFTIDSSFDSVYLEFDWKCQGENAAGATQYDYGTVVITTTGTTPVAGTEVSTTQATAGGNGRIGADDNLGKFNLNYGTNPGTTWNVETIDLTDYVGQTKRIVFTWNNDGSVGTDPPFVVDNIKIIGYKF